MAEVSIIIPVYNVAKYIRRCLESVVSQTYQKIECILVDDCGTDNSMIIVKDFINHYQGEICFKAVHHSHNLGLSAARNTGIRVSTGKYLYFLDSDDSITPDCIETLLFLFSKYPDISFSQGNILKENGEISTYGFNHSIPEYIHDKEDIYKFLLSKITTSAWNRLISRDFIIENSLYFPVGMIHEDMYWIYFVAKHTTAAAFSLKGTYTYFINEGSLITSISREKRIARYSSRLEASWIYMEDIDQFTSSKYQRQYLSTNLLSCLTELIQLSSFHHWFVFWKAILAMAIKYYHHFSIFRLCFLILLFPPACFFSGHEKCRWRIQQSIVPKL